MDSISGFRGLGFFMSDSIHALVARGEPLHPLSGTLHFVFDDVEMFSVPYWIVRKDINEEVLHLNVDSFLLGCTL